MNLLETNTLKEEKSPGGRKIPWRKEKSIATQSCDAYNNRMMPSKDDLAIVNVQRDITYSGTLSITDTTLLGKSQS